MNIYRVVHTFINFGADSSIQTGKQVLTHMFDNADQSLDQLVHRIALLCIFSVGKQKTVGLY